MYVLACVAMHAFIIIISHQNTQIYSAVHTYTHMATQTHTTHCSCLLDEQYCQHIRLGPVGCRLYGFMLHHQAVSRSVDYNSQKPLIKRCAWEHFSLLLYLFLNEHSIDLLTVQRSASKPNSARYYKLAGLWNTVQQNHLLFLLWYLLFFMAIIVKVIQFMALMWHVYKGIVENTECREDIWSRPDNKKHTWFLNQFKSTECAYTALL